MANSADLDQLASSEANWSGSTLFEKGRVCLGSTGQGLTLYFVKACATQEAQDYL